jgi:hypothetical protein
MWRLRVKHDAPDVLVAVEHISPSNTSVGFLMRVQLFGVNGPLDLAQG